MRYFLIICFVLLSFNTMSQDYFRAAGFRGGYISGFTYKQFLDDEMAVEGLISFKYRGIQATVLRLFHRPALFEFSDNLYFVYGYGGHFGYTYSDKISFFFNRYYYDEEAFYPIIGMDAYFGVEYPVRNYPFVISFNYKPFFEYSIPGFFKVNLSDFAFSFKYTF